MNIKIQFDGGSIPNPGRMYGSYSIEFDDVEICSVTQEFGEGTNNVAEFQSLFCALEKTLDLLEGSMKPARFCSLEILTDSTIVRNRIMNPNKNRGNSDGAMRMAEWSSKCLSILKGFKHYECKWQPRQANVDRFGH